MKYIIASICALGAMSIFYVLNKFVFNYLISDFFIGWCCCTVFDIALKVYKELTRKS